MSSRSMMRALRPSSRTVWLPAQLDCRCVALEPKDRQVLRVLKQISNVALDRLADPDWHATAWRNDDDPIDLAL